MSETVTAALLQHEAASQDLSDAAAPWHPNLAVNSLKSIQIVSETVTAALLQHEAADEDMSDADIPWHAALPGKFCKARGTQNMSAAATKHTKCACHQRLLHVYLHV